MAFKKYFSDVTFPDLQQQATRSSRNLIKSLKEAVEAQLEYDVVSQGKTDAQLASDLGVPEQSISDVKQTFNAIRDIDAIVEGDDTVTIPTGNTFGERMRKFS